MLCFLISIIVFYRDRIHDDDEDDRMIEEADETDPSQPMTDHESKVSIQYHDTMM